MSYVATELARGETAVTWRTSLTLRRVFPAALLLMIFVLALRQCALIDPDLWWHLKAGEDIFAAGAIPRTDIYSHTKAGSEWVTHEWLSEALIYLLFRFSGWGGLAAVFSALIAATFWLVYWRCEGRPYVASVAVLAASAASFPLFGVRPQMFTFLLTVIYVGILNSHARGGGGRSLWPLVPLMLLWVNLHAGFALGLGLVGLYIVRAALDGQWRLTPSLAAALAACAAMVPLNPHGFRMFSYPYETLTSPSMAAFIQEWGSPDFHQVMYLPFAATVFLTFGLLALSPRRVSKGDLFLLVVTAFGAFRSARHIPIFSVLAAPFIAEHLWATLRARGWDQSLAESGAAATWPKLALNLLFVAAPAALCVVRVWDFAARQPAYEARRYPAAAVEFIRASRPPGPIYNRYGWGGYVINKLSPDYPVYIDGRADVYGDELMTEAMTSYDGGKHWQQTLERHSVRTVLVEPGAPIASLLRQTPGWEKIYEDCQAVVFTRAGFGLAGAAVAAANEAPANCVRPRS
jgi:hypothetical protein